MNSFDTFNNILKSKNIPLKIMTTSNIIALCGYKRCGKDFASDILLKNIIIHTINLLIS